MKIELREFDGCFSFNIQAENMEEAAKLVRFGMNRTGDIRSCCASATATGEFEASIVFGKSRRANSYVPKRA